MATKKSTAKKSTKTTKTVKKSTTKKVTQPKATAKKPATTKKKKIEAPSLLRGVKDTLARDEKYWRLVSETAQEFADAYGYGRMQPPVIEEASLFMRSIGEGTDVVDKEMYVFDDRDGTRIALRPEFTAGIARAYTTHGLHSESQPVKVWSIGPVFRHDRPQAGRFRQFHQWGAEALGTRDSVIDAELISMAYHSLVALGIKPVVHINSIGSPEDRERYVVELTGYLRSKRSYLSDLSKQRLTKNPLRILDSKEPQDQEVVEEAPQIIDWISDDSRKYFMAVLEYLDELEIPYVLTPTLVRGLDYYTDTVFEFYPEGREDASQGALGGGGRYDLLVQRLGGRETPAAGFGLGIERVITAMRKIEEDGTELKDPRMQSSIYFAQLGKQAQRKALRIIELLRQDGIMVHHNLAKGSLKQQLEEANKFGVTHALILGHQEVQDGTIIIRDMESGNQEIVDQNKIKKEVRRILK
jgi:histidyl-tRNA synthetase